MWQVNIDASARIRSDQLPAASRRRGWLVALAALFALTLTLLLAALGSAGRVADWKATEFQLQNLDAVPAHITATLFSEQGTPVFSLTRTIDPGSTAYLRPEQMGLDPAFVGTLRVETEQEVAGAVMHLKGAAPDLAGNDVFQMVSDRISSTVYYAARVERSASAERFASRILIVNLGQQQANVVVEIVDLSGNPGPITELAIPINGSQTLDLTKLAGLPEEFVGAARVAADQPIHVDVIRSTETQWAIFAAQTSGSARLFAPVVKGLLPGVVTPTIHLFNASLNSAAQVTVCGTVQGSCTVRELGPGAGQAIRPTAAGAHIIESSEPVMAVIGTEGAEGSSAYAAGPQEPAGTHLAAPMLFGDYEGWLTTLWVLNTGVTTATVRLRYVSIDGQSRVLAPVQVAAGQAQAFEPVSLAVHYAAWVEADRPIVGMIEGVNARPEVEDGYFTYWATPYTPRGGSLYLPVVSRR